MKRALNSAMHFFVFSLFRGFVVEAPFLLQLICFSKTSDYESVNDLSKYYNFVINGKCFPAFSRIYAGMLIINGHRIHSVRTTNIRFLKFKTRIAKSKIK